MKQLLTIIFILIFSKSISQAKQTDFDINYEIEKLTDEKYSVRVSIKNISAETLYLSNYKSEVSYKSEKIGFCDFSYSMITDPLLSPKMLFYFIKLESGETFNGVKIISVKSPEEIVVKFDYLFESKKLFRPEKPESDYALTCKDYVELAYNEGKIKHKSQKFRL